MQSDAQHQNIAGRNVSEEDSSDAQHNRIDRDNKVAFRIMSARGKTDGRRWPIDSFNRNGGTQTVRRRHFKYTRVVCCHRMVSITD